MDIVLGSTPDFFSAGELTYVIREGFFDEYCSCGQKIKECPLWSDVFKEWIDQMDMEFSEYRVLRNKFEGNKAFLRVVKNHLWPSQEWKEYSKVTKLFYDLIYYHTSANLIIDSSKPSTRLFLLNGFAKVRGLHVCRSFAGVLNSEKKNVQIDLKNGIESASAPKPTMNVFRAWLLTNLTCAFAAIFMNIKRVKFDKFIDDPTILRRFNPALPVQLTDGLYKPEHMVAGNAIRLKPPQKIKKATKIKYDRLTKFQKGAAALIDRLFWFWS